MMKVSVIGAGTMGGGIAMCFAQVGVQVILKDIKQKFLDNGMKMILKNWKRSELKGKWSHYQVMQMRKLITTTLSYENFSQVDMVIEAVFENMKIKKQILSRVVKICFFIFIFSNTASITISTCEKFS
jgi:3-hydroxyacyl-CoA dehydrogenase